MSTYQKKWWTMFFLTKRQWILRLSQKSRGFVFSDPWIYEWWLWFVSVSTLEEKDDILIKLWRSTPLFLPLIPISSNSKLVPFTCKYLQLSTPLTPILFESFFLMGHWFMGHWRRTQIKPTTNNWANQIYLAQSKIRPIRCIKYLRRLSFTCIWVI